MIDELLHAFENQTFEAFHALLHRRVQHLSVCLVDGKVVSRAEAEALAARLVARLEGVLAQLAVRPGDALRVLDALRATGYTQLEASRDGFVRAREQQFPPPAAATWRELAELRALASIEPARCELGAPVTHIEFAARLAENGPALPAELLALYAACGSLALGCRHVALPALRICAGDALRARDGRIVLFERMKRRPNTGFLDHPGLAIAWLDDDWWLVLEDDRPPETRRPLDVPSMLRYALRRADAPSFEVLVTDLAWRRFFTA